MQERERDIQKAILDFLTLKLIFHYKNNTAGIYKQATGTYIQSRIVGAPDIVAVIREEVRRHRSEEAGRDGRRLRSPRHDRAGRNRRRGDSADPGDEQGGPPPGRRGCRSPFAAPARQWPPCRQRHGRFRRYRRRHRRAVKGHRRGSAPRPHSARHLPHLHGRRRHTRAPAPVRPRA